jgi:hypothetical protein
MKISIISTYGHIENDTYRRAFAFKKFIVRAPYEREKKNSNIEANTRSPVETKEWDMCGGGENLRRS